MSSTSRLWRQQLRFLSTFTSATRPHPRTSKPTISTPTNLLLRPRAPQSKRFQSTKPPTPDPTPESRQTHRAHAILTHASRFIPRRLHPYLHRLRTAPFSHVAAFLVLHELTAILPLFGLTYLFYSMDWVPTSWVLGPWAATAEEGLRRWMRYFRRKGWFGLGEGKGGGDGGREGEEVLEERLRGEVEREREREKEGKGRWGWLRRWRRRDDDADARDGISKSVDEKESKTRATWRKVRGMVTADHTEKGIKSMGDTLAGKRICSSETFDVEETQLANPIALHFCIYLKSITNRQKVFSLHGFLFVAVRTICLTDSAM
ncbi:hypothetical protein F4805DRAFT_474456 [Annulohypoxylon moriforme]|nr:hypothetical protein F4805DRAFT_474456 [Annulohypoxylon moriforme]